MCVLMTRSAACLVSDDNRAEDLTKEGMRQGIITSGAFILFLSAGILTRPFCRFLIVPVLGQTALNYSSSSRRPIRNTRGTRAQEARGAHS